ncbi:tetratricopeptide repeat protein [Pseudodesulfovibrio sp. JC047]|uniref:SPOR domain-containing protein n=1 Tax=Pseudodesulfovibrio sp. JC047 TaxID=2683199 RepID=UPI0013CFAA84|nr:tetratricopeptide repeat protein [Pseudodesulfovibrio sp. JC047]NDV20703.1 tetratricopeptide repeat protein [Pseudodesulfovibrio sp. JC047]
MKTRIQFLIVMVAGMVLAGCAASSRNDMTFDELAYGDERTVSLTSEQHEQVGDGFVRRVKPEMALIHYNKAIALDATNMDVRVKRGELLVAEGLDEQALAEFNNVLKQDADHAIANQAAGGVYFRAGLFDEARLHLEKAVQLNPLLWKSHNYLGILEDRDGHYDAAANHFSQALAIHQGTGVDTMYNNLGVVHIARKEYSKAIDSFRLALKAGGISVRTYNNLGLALTRAGRLDEALESFKYAGGEAKAYNNLGYVLLTDDQPARAVPYFEKALTLSPSYYVKAADNLKRARLAARFQRGDAQTPLNGSTPNPLLRPSFPDAKQNPGEPAATPASAGSPSSDDGLLKGPFEADVRDEGKEGVSYGLHVSSWSSSEKAAAQCVILREKGFETWINSIDLGPKGTWYRVLVGRFDSIAEARRERDDVLVLLNVDRAPVLERDLAAVADAGL